MKRTITILSLVLFGITLTQCKDNQTPTVESTVPHITETAQEEPNQLAFLGTYQGVYPWEEEGQNMQVLNITTVIKDGNVYTYKVVTEDGEHNETGEWELEGDRLYLREDEYSAAKAFLLRGGKLHFLDSEGDVVNENELGDYILEKK
ncbi:hypothetical protein LNQ81_09275 [Myroides sp. M-43]|uniref:hypothetical protein n=1 Tax=Myroides oncorhynchi TaxID=2893756 RepID=UPI001E397843|nr:hypothetical protein [Myroides oncorhynchi]MCC9042866.1 hypothetical protein [Myroides oncorhynchi]